MANNQIAKVDQFRGILNTPTIRAQLRNALHDNAGSFMTSMIDLYTGDTTLQNCDPEQVALQCIKAATLKLPLIKSLGFAYVVPYKNVPTFIIGYKGLIQLAMRTGQYKVINADAVFEGEYQGVTKLTGELKLDGERTSDKVVGYFAYFKLINGFEKMLYMTFEQVSAWAVKYSKSYNSSYSPWKTEFDKMATKTVLRRLIGTYGIMSSDMQAAVDADDKNTVDAEIKDKANKVPLDPDSYKEVNEQQGEQPPECDHGTGEVKEDSPQGEATQDAPKDNGKKADAPAAPKADF